MCCCCGLHVTTISSSIFTLIQSLIGLALSGFVIVNYNNCISWMSGIDSLHYFYFYRPKCYSVAVDTQFNYVDRTLNWGISYLALNSCWLLASFLMAVTSCCNPKKTATYFLYSPWIIVTLSIVIADLTATIIYFNDITAIQDMLGDAMNHPKDWELFMGPIIMGLIFSRLIIGWIINLVILICVSVAVVRRWKEPDNNKVLTTMFYGWQPDGRTQPGAPPLKQDDDRNAGFLPRVKPNADLNANTSPGDLPVSHNSHYLGARVHSLISQQPRVMVPDPKYREADVDREEVKLSSSPKGYIPGVVSSQQNEEDVLPTGKHKYPTVVRNQLPWSYFQNPEVIQHPVPKQPGVEEDLDSPPVPVPDYSLHIGKRPTNRSRKSSSSGSDASTGNSSYPRPAKDGSLERISSGEADVLY